MATVEIKKPTNPQEAWAVIQQIIKRAKEEESKSEEERLRQIFAEEMRKLLGMKQEEAKQEVEKKVVEEEEVAKQTQRKPEPKTVAKMLQQLVETPSTDEDVLAFQELNDALYLASRITKRAPQEFVEYKEFFSGKSPLAKRISKALNQDVSGAGAEWTPTGFSAKFIERVETERRLLKIHPEVDIPRGVKELEIPGASTAVQMFYYPDTAEDEAAKIPAQTAGTRKVTLRPKTLACRVLIPETYEEDCALPIAQLYRDEMIKAYARAIDNLFINGDASGNLNDYDLTSSLDVRKMYDGYRSICRVNGNRAAISGSSISLDDLRERLQAMGVYGSPSDVVVITSIDGFWKLTQTQEVVAWNQYQGKPLLPQSIGVIPSLGIEIIVTDQCPNTLDASGDKTADGTKTCVLIVYRKAFMVGKKRELGFKNATDAETGREILIARARLAFVPAYDTSENFVGEVYNV